MESVSQSEDRAALLALVQEINDAWRSHQTGALHELFHEDMIIVGPGFAPLAKGRPACVASYEDFLRSAAVQAYSETVPTIEIWGDTATATYGWEMTYALEGQTYTETGHDAFVFARAEGRWRAVWRAMMPSAPAG
ncbi:MAG TPA: nuclear transport factor 2 family protein [Polyangia bacterium]|jgi:uncharacterized protein (TIGR02246 family)|nr:nuclear transport factor 2 family protein [Polyangia bacterium]